jgi:hypothetical protein
MKLSNAFATIAIAHVLFAAGCAGMNGLSQTLGVNSTSRVPPPPTGSFNVPNNYTNGVSTGAAAPMGASPTVSQQSPHYIEQPANQLLSSINRIQSQVQQSADQVRSSVNRITDDVNSRVVAAGASVNRIGEGVIQAGAVLNESVQDAQGNLPAVISAPIQEEPNAAWRSPSTTR